MTKLISIIGWIIIHLISKTIRVRKINLPDFDLVKRKNVVYVFWHGEQFMLFYHHRNRGVAVMSSLSKDGEIQSGILSLFGFSVVRGSSSRGAQRALVEMIRNLKKGRSAAFAVDGPRGPLHEVKPGALFAAQKSSCCLLPLSSCVRRYSILSKAWDKYELPHPLSRGVIVYGNPVTVDENEDIEKQAQKLKNSLDSLSAFSHKGYWSRDIKEYLLNHPRPKILIVQPSRIGDVVFSLPALLAIRKKYPHAWIGWFVDERCAPLIEGNPAIDEVIVFDRAKLSPGYLINIRSYLHKKNIDVSIDLHGLSKSAFMVLLSGARFKIGSSSTNGMREFSWLFSKEIKPDKEQSHCVERHLAAAKYLGAENPAVEYTMTADEDAAKNVELILSNIAGYGKKPLVVIHPGGGWISRRWFTDRFASLIDRLSDTGASVVIVGGREGGAAEKGLNEEIVSMSRSKVTDLTDKLSLKELIALLKKASVFVANEAGPMHIATALNVPSIALLGPTDPSRTGPFGGKTSIIRHKVDCQPCRERNCKTKKCMDLITVDEVYNTAIKIIAIKVKAE